MIRLVALLIPLTIQIPAGSYRPLYAEAAGARISVGAFRIDRREVTRGAFLAFVKEHPEWRRDRIASPMADPQYLASWRSPLDAGAGADLELPATQVSLLAARAFCSARSERLPTVDEWEYVAAASRDKRDANADVRWRATLLSLYTTRNARSSVARHPGEVNAYGVHDLHGRVWEWTDNSARQASVHHHHDASTGGIGKHMYCASASIGASDPTNYPAFLRTAVRSALTPRTTMSSLGFRCAA